MPFNAVPDNVAFTVVRIKYTSHYKKVFVFKVLSERVNVLVHNVKKHF